MEVLVTFFIFPFIVYAGMESHSNIILARQKELPQVSPEMLSGSGV